MLEVFWIWNKQRMFSSYKYRKFEKKFFDYSFNKNIKGRKKKQNINWAHVTQIN